MSAKNPLVGIIMGSDSDLAVMRAAADVCREFGVESEIAIISAHRTPDRATDYARTASDRGLRVIIAGAGGAAHLAGVIAALTTLPVIGVPVQLSALSGLDSLLSIVQMPKGIPVATVAIGNAANAGLLAVRILATSNQELAKKMAAYQEDMRTTIERKQAHLEDVGVDAYLAGKKSS